MYLEVPSLTVCLDMLLILVRHKRNLHLYLYFCIQLSLHKCDRNSRVCYLLHFRDYSNLLKGISSSSLQNPSITVSYMTNTIDKNKINTHIHYRYRYN